MRSGDGCLIGEGGGWTGMVISVLGNGKGKRNENKKNGSQKGFYVVLFSMSSK